jgi:hypothetical protein
VESKSGQGLVMFVRYLDRKSRVTGQGSRFTSVSQLDAAWVWAVNGMKSGEIRRVWFEGAIEERAAVDIHVVHIHPTASPPHNSPLQPTATAPPSP